MTDPGQIQRRALVVEDDSYISELGALMLEQFGLAVTQVRTAEEAIDHLRACGGEVDVLIADIHLPGAMDGVSLVRSVAVLWPMISLIVTSGDLEARLGDLPTRASFVPKPWRALDIVSLAERASRDDHSVHALRHR
jgi:DNA-binding NtrC family response regulator